MPRRKAIKITPEMRITPEIKLDAYVWVLLVLEGTIDYTIYYYDRYRTYAICLLLDTYIRNAISSPFYSIHHNKSDFPELFALKPANKNIGEHWFNPTYTRPRIRLLKKAIKMVGKI